MSLINSIRLLVLVLFLSGCMSLQQDPKTIDYYTLEYTLPQPAFADPLPVVLQVERFGAAPPYDTARMVYRAQEFERNTYVYHQWESPPGNLVAYRLASDLQTSGLLRAVLPPHGRMAVTHSLNGTIEAFYEKDTPEGAYAVLHLTLTLTDRHEPDPAARIVLQRTYREEEPCIAGHPPELVRAMSQAMARVAENVIRDMVEELGNSAKR